MSSSPKPPPPRALDFLAGAVFGVVVGVGVTLLLGRGSGRTTFAEAAAPSMPQAPPEPFVPPGLPPMAASSEPGQTSGDDASAETKRRRVQAGLLAKVEAGKANIAEIRMLKALCQSTGDKACVVRANTELAKATAAEPR